MKFTKLIKITASVLSVLFISSLLPSCKASDVDGTDAPDTGQITREENLDIVKTSVNSVDLGEYVIVYEDEPLFRITAKELATAIFENRGYELKVKEDDGKEEKYEILLGNVPRSITKEHYKTPVKHFTEYKIEIKGDKIAILATDKQNTELAKKMLLEKLLDADGSVTEITDSHSFGGDIYEEYASSVAIKKRANDSDIRIASNNIFCHQKTEMALYKNRKDPLLKSFAAMDADVLMLQECGYYKSASPSKTTWHDEIDPTLKRMGYTMVPAELEKPAIMNYTPIWYRADKLRLVECKYNLYDSVKYSPDAYLSDSKSYTTAVFEDLRTGKKFACISTHFTWAASPDLAGRLRKSDAEEAKLEVLALKEKYGESFPIILMGDLNCTVQAPPYVILDSVMDNVRYMEDVEQNNTDYGTSHELGSKPGVGSAIDHTFITGTDFKPVLYQHAVNYWAIASTDHIPLVLDIDLTQNK